jgi:hypothetical protein
LGVGSTKTNLEHGFVQLFPRPQFSRGSLVYWGKLEYCVCCNVLESEATENIESGISLVMGRHETYVLWVLSNAWVTDVGMMSVAIDPELEPGSVRACLKARHMDLS